MYRATGRPAPGRRGPRARLSRPGTGGPLAARRDRPARRRLRHDALREGPGVLLRARLHLAHPQGAERSLLRPVLGPGHPLPRDLPAARREQALQDLDRQGGLLRGRDRDGHHHRARPRLRARAGSRTSTACTSRVPAARTCAWRATTGPRTCGPRAPRPARSASTCRCARRARIASGSATPRRPIGAAAAARSAASGSPTALRSCRQTIPDHDLLRQIVDATGGRLVDGRLARLHDLDEIARTLPARTQQRVVDRRERTQWDAPVGPAAPRRPARRRVGAPQALADDLTGRARVLAITAPRRGYLLSHAAPPASPAAAPRLRPPRDAAPARGCGPGGRGDRDRLMPFAVRESNRARFAVKEIRRLLADGRTAQGLRLAQRVLDEMPDDFFRVATPRRRPGGAWRRRTSATCWPRSPRTSRTMYDRLSRPSTRPLMERALRDHDTAGARRDRDAVRCERGRASGDPTPRGPRPARAAARARRPGGPEGLRYVSRATRACGCGSSTRSPRPATGDALADLRVSPTGSPSPAARGARPPSRPACGVAGDDAAADASARGLADVVRRRRALRAARRAGAPSREPAVERADPRLARRCWTRTSPRARWTGATASPSRRTGAPSARCTPWSDGRMVYVADGRSVRALDLYSGRPFWVYDRETERDLPSDLRRAA